MASQNLEKTKYITKEGIERVVVIEAEDKISKSGNKMIVLTFENYKCERGRIHLTQTSNNQHIINNKLKMIGLNTKYKINNEDFIGKIFKVKGEYKFHVEPTVLGEMIKVKSNFMSFEIIPMN